MNSRFIQILSDSSFVNGETGNIRSNNLWMWVALIELGIIALILAKKKKAKQTADLSEERILTRSKSNAFDMDSLMNNIHKSRALYKKLTAASHPDRFADPLLNERASQIFKEVTDNKHNYKRLLELQSIIETQLTIKQ